jgi:hypothetical protein
MNIKDLGFLEPAQLGQTAIGMTGSVVNDCIDEYGDRGEISGLLYPALCDSAKAKTPRCTPADSGRRPGFGLRGQEYGHDLCKRGVADLSG